VFTDIEVDVEELLHNNVPVYPDAVSVEVPSQLLTTETIGADGVVFGAAVPDPDELIHPFTVCVTVDVPEVLTVIDGVVADVLHNNVPV
jgi:hypothetical protein